MVVNPRTRLTVALVALAAALFALVPAGPASAHTATVVIEARVTLNSGTLGCGQGTLAGTVSGSHGGTPIVRAPVSGNFAYCDGLDGAAEGSITVGGAHSCAFAWRKTGTVATVTSDCNGDGRYDDGSGVAVIIPTSAPGAIPGTAHMTYVGDFIFAS